MNEQQQSNLNGRKKIGKLEMTKEVVYALNGMELLALFAFGFFFTVFEYHSIGKGFKFSLFPHSSISHKRDCRIGLRDNQDI